MSWVSINGSHREIKNLRIVETDENVGTAVTAKYTLMVSR
jgi:hypothetical protein